MRRFDHCAKFSHLLYFKSTSSNVFKNGINTNASENNIDSIHTDTHMTEDATVEREIKTTKIHFQSKKEICMKKLFKKKKSKLGTAAKILVPAAGIIAAKKLWDNKEILLTEDVRTKILEKTEAVQDKVQQFHDFIQNSTKDSVETTFVDEETEETIFADDTAEEKTKTGEERNNVKNETSAEDVENTEDTEKAEENNA